MKSVFGAPRPYQMNPDLYAPLKTPDFGLPSGHAQYVSVTWGFLATQFGSRFWWVLAVVLTVLVSISRVYLGDHFPQDVIAGVLIGAAYLAGYLALEARTVRWLETRANLWGRLAVAVIGPLFLTVVFLDQFSAVVLGAPWLFVRTRLAVQTADPSAQDEPAMRGPPASITSRYNHFL